MYRESHRLPTFENDSRLMYEEDSAQYSAAQPSALRRCCMSCNRSNALFYPFLFIITLTILFFILMLVAFSQSASNKPTPTTWTANDAIIGTPMILPNDGPYIQFIILHMNDVYEMNPLADGTRGGLARVAYVRSLLLQENSNTYTVLAGDLLSPSALSSALMPDGSELTGRQMIATMNVLGLQYAVYGNHEFDLPNAVLQNRIADSDFKWMSANVFQVAQPSALYPPAGANKGYVFLPLITPRVLMLSLTIDTNKGSPLPGYVSIPNVTASIQVFQRLLRNPLIVGQYDILIALTHWTLESDQLLMEAIPNLSLIMGGHEHANYYLTRGTTFNPITKADSNDATVYIHRIAYNTNTQQVIIQSHLQIVDQNIPMDPTVNQTITYWWNTGMAGFERAGFKPLAVVCTLPTGVEWDGRSEVVRTHAQNALNQALCQSLMTIQGNGDEPYAAIMNTGSIRIDDFIAGTLTQYDVLRVLPFNNNGVLIRVNGSTLYTTMNVGNTPGTGEFLAYCGALQYAGGVYRLDGVPLSQSDGNMYVIATSDYYYTHSALAPGELLYTAQLMSKQFIQYLTNNYPH